MSCIMSVFVCRHDWGMASFWSYCVTITEWPSLLVMCYEVIHIHVECQGLAMRLGLALGQQGCLVLSGAVPHAQGRWVPPGLSSPSLTEAVLVGSPFPRPPDGIMARTFCSSI